MPSKNSKNSKNDDRERSRPKSRNDLNKLTKRELKELCGEHGLATSGKRNDLFERLSIFFDFFEDNGDDDGIEKDTQEEKKDEEDDQKEEIEEEESDKETEKEPKVDVGKSDIPNGFNELLTLNKQRDSKEGLTTIIEGYDKLLETEPDNEYILVHKGVSLQYMQEYEQAVECYSSALKINPNNIEARMLLEGCRVMGLIISTKK